MKKIVSQKHNQVGFSLIEVIVSVSIFVVILLSMTNILKLVIDAQRQAIATQNVEESLRYFFEVISKEIRMTKKSTGICPNVPIGAMFATSSNALGDILYLQNYHDECIAYSLYSGDNASLFLRSRNSDSAPITPSKVNINDLRFMVHNAVNEQAYVSINLSANYIGNNVKQSEMRVQTTITSRYYRP